MRKIKISQGEYYHLYNRGVLKQTVFLDKRDYTRFLCLILYFQSLVTLPNIGRYTTNYVQHSVLNISGKITNKIIDERHVALNAFCLMPNHFHLLVYEKEEGGIARYMQRVLNAYTKYFNTKYKKTGHLFQGPYQAVHVQNNEQLLHLSAYIHKNPRELKSWKDSEVKYQWSSYQDYQLENRWGLLLDNEVIIGQFSSLDKYKKFVKTSLAKEKVLDLPN